MKREMSHLLGCALLGLTVMGCGTVSGEFTATEAEAATTAPPTVTSTAPPTVTTTTAAPSTMPPTTAPPATLDPNGPQTPGEHPLAFALTTPDELAAIGLVGPWDAATYSLQAPTSSDQPPIECGLPGAPQNLGVVFEIRHSESKESLTVLLSTAPEPAAVIDLHARLAEVCNLADHGKAFISELNSVPGATASVRLLPAEGSPIGFVVASKADKIVVVGGSSDLDWQQANALASRIISRL